MSYPASPQFQSLAFKGTSSSRWVVSLALHTAAIALLLAIPATVERTFQPASRVRTVTLIAPPPPQPLRIPVPPRVAQVRPVTAPKRFQPPVVTQVVAHVVTPALVRSITVSPAPVIAASAPQFELPGRVTVNTVPPPSPEATPRPIKTGTFGNPDGALAAAMPAKGTAAPQLGSFDAQPAAGSHGQGNGPRLVASAGFGSLGSDTGNGSSPTGSRNGSAGIRKASFGEYEPASHDAPAAAAALPRETPVEITFKPKPVYTPEAREKKVEGEVQLEVLFSSTGHIHVLRVIRGLGFGLDESARSAASQIRFRPCTRNGDPVDMTGTVHIVFQLS